MAADTSVVPRSGCSITSAMGSAADGEQGHEPTAVDLAAELGRHPGEADDQAELGELGRLQLERSDLEPALGAVLARAER